MTQLGIGLTYHHVMRASILFYDFIFEMHEVSLEIIIILLICPCLRVQHGAPYVQVIYLYLSFIIRFIEFCKQAPRTENHKFPCIQVQWICPPTKDLRIQLLTIQGLTASSKDPLQIVKLTTQSMEVL